MNIDSEALAKQCIKAALGLAVMCTILFWGDWWYVLFAWLMVYPTSFVLAFAAAFVLDLAGATISTPKIWMNQDENIIERVGAVGQLGEAQIHEYIVLKRPDNGEPVKLYFDRCVDLTKNWEPPDQLWFVVESGGILYVQSKEAEACEPENAPSENRDLS